MVSPWPGGNPFANAPRPTGGNPFANVGGLPQAGGAFGGNPFANVDHPRGNPFANLDTAFDVANPEDIFLQIAAKNFGQSPTGTTPGGPTGGTGSPAPTDADWSGVNQWDTTIQAAAQKAGIDPDYIRAVMKLESNGDPNAAGSDGVWGPMQVNSNAWGQGPWSTDAVANIQKGAEILKFYLDANGGDFYQALRGYHGYGWDGNTSDTDYADIVVGNYNALKGMNGGTGGAGSTPATGGTSFLAVTGGQGDVTFEFNAHGGADLYGYGAGHGLDGSGHTGIDIGVPYGTTLYAPMGGTVVCAGTNTGGGAHGNGCAAFGDDGGGVGRVELLLDNGASVILGHASAALVQLGQRVNAGQAVARSGTAGTGAHVHLEARTYQGNDYTIVDPRSVLGQGAVATVSGGTTPAATGGGIDYTRIWEQPLELIYG